MRTLLVLLLLLAGCDSVFGTPHRDPIPPDAAPIDAP